ncbi:MAG: LysR substrate-binding domain-containing protein, partial [Curvibacter sp.]
ELGSNEAVREAVAGGLGLAVISVHALAPKPATQGVAVLDVQGFPIASQWHIVYPKGKRLSPIAEVFRQQLVAQAGQLLAQAR